MAAGIEEIAVPVFIAPERKVGTKIFLLSQRSREMGQQNGYYSARDISLHSYCFLNIRDSWANGEIPAILDFPGKRSQSLLHQNDLVVISWKPINLAGA